MIVRELKTVYKNTGVEIKDYSKINMPSQAVNILRDFYSTLDTHLENFVVIYLSTNNKPLAIKLLSIGTEKATLVSIKELIRHALNLSATGLIISHNHPSGNLDASDADKNITEKVKSACNIFDIELLDALIITETDYISITNG